MNEHVFISQLTSAAIVVYGIQKLKEAKWFPWLTDTTHTLTRITSAFLAVIGAIGVHVAFDQHSGILTVTGLTVTTILSGAWHWANQYALQQMIYDSVLNKPAAVPPAAQPKGSQT